VVICFPIGIISCFLLLVPIPFTRNTFTANPNAAPCAGIATENATSCGALSTCIGEMIANGTLPSHDSSVYSVRPRPGGGLAAWFAVFYFAYYFFSWTCTMIPYDALGMELTSDYSTRVSLFSVKSLFQFAGYVLPNAAGLVLSRIFPDDIVSNYAYTAVILAVVGLIALVVLAYGVTERPSACSGEGNNVPPVVALRRALQNRPYLIYLALKFPIALISLMPINLLSYFLRYGMLIEDWSGLFYSLQVLGLASSFLSVPLVWWLTRRFGKRECLVYSEATFLPLFVVFFFIPPASLPTWLIYLLGVMLAYFTVIAFVVLDSMLADIIDYDTLLTGKRSEGVYTVAETNLQQFMEIIGGVVPLLVMDAFGFNNNGGCSCGCGVKCDKVYLRWDCPGDVGYTCTGGFDSPPLYGNPERTAPCLIQDNAGVVWVLRVLLFAVTGFLLLLSVIPACRYPISKAKHAMILEATEEMSTKGSTTDPLTGKALNRRPSDAKSLSLEHFTAGELKSQDSLPLWLGVRLCFWFGCTVAIIVAMAATSGDVQMNIVTLGAILAAGLFVLVPYDLIRLKVALGLKKNQASV
jgi:Na+/melibiose symporter-like transporter